MELVALVPALLLLALVAWQLAVAAHSWTLAQGSARAAGRAHEVGAPVSAAARAVLPAGHARRARVGHPRRRPGAGAAGGAAGGAVRPGARRGHRHGPLRRGGPVTRRADRGQASLELLAMVPLVLLAGLLAWQLVAVLAAGFQAQEEVRARALGAGAGPGATTTVTATVAVPPVLPGVRGLRFTARAAVRTP